MSHNRHTHILDQVSAYYSDRLTDHGPTPRGVDWKDVESHEVRHRQFLRLINDPTASVLDLGCGLGDFLRYLRGAGHTGFYIGYDVAAKMIEQAAKLHGESAGVSWKVGAIPAEQCDFAIASGVFNVKGTVLSQDWERYIEDTVDVLARAGRRGFGFNVLSLSSDPDRRRQDLHYADPAVTLQWCLGRFGRSVAILQDYGLYEFTVLVRHT